MNDGTEPSPSVKRVPNSDEDEQSYFVQEVAIMSLYDL